MESSEDLKKEIDVLLKQCEIYEKQLPIIDTPEEGVLYKIKKGRKYTKEEKEKSWHKCCKSELCWRMATHNSFCSFHKHTNNTKQTTIYYIPLQHRKNQAPICQYRWRYKTGKHLKGECCCKEAQYIAKDGITLCTNHVNIYKTSGAIIYRKRHNQNLPKDLLHVFAPE